ASATSPACHRIELGSHGGGTGILLTQRSTASAIRSRRSSVLTIHLLLVHGAKGDPAGEDDGRGYTGRGHRAPPAVIAAARVSTILCAAWSRWGAPPDSQKGRLPAQQASRRRGSGRSAA